MRRGRRGRSSYSEMKKTAKPECAYNIHAITYIRFVKSCGNFSYFCVQLWSNNPKIPLTDKMEFTRTTVRITNTADARGEFRKCLCTIIYSQYYHIRTLFIVKLLRHEITTLAPELRLSSWIYYHEVYDALSTARLAFDTPSGVMYVYFPLRKKKKYKHNIIVRHKETDPFFDRLRSRRSAICYCQTKTICSSNNITTSGRSRLEDGCFCQLQNTSASGTTISRPAAYIRHILNNIVLYSLRTAKEMHTPGLGDENYTNSSIRRACVWQSHTSIGEGVAMGGSLNHLDLELAYNIICSIGQYVLCI